jgi:hypothetical protein
MGREGVWINDTTTNLDVLDGVYEMLGDKYTATFYRDTTLALVLESEKTAQHRITGNARVTNTWVDFRLRRMGKMNGIRLLKTNCCTETFPVVYRLFTACHCPDHFIDCFAAFSLAAQVLNGGRTGRFRHFFVAAFQ